MSSEYFGQNRVDPDNYKKYKSEKCSKIYLGITSSLGLISILVLIALNVTNLLSIISSNKDNGFNTNQHEKIISLVTDSNEMINTQMIPKMSLISSSTTLTIPTLIKDAARTIKYEIYKYCNINQNTMPNTCPTNPNLGHSELFQLFDPNLLVECLSGERANVPPKSMTPVVFDSFIPSTTTIRGCTRIPSFSLGDQVFSYTHNQIARGCGDSSVSNQDWIIGYIVEGYNQTPSFEIAQRWYFDDNLNRKSCSTTATGKGAWLICSLVTMSEAMDYRTPGIMDIFLAYMDVYGRRQSWIYTESEISFDNSYIAIYPSVGSGISVNGRIYFLMYGGLETKIQGNARCSTEMCVGLSTNQEICNRAQSPSWSGGKQVLNSILSFDDQISEKPNITVTTIDPKYQTIGAEGRLYYAPYSQKIYIYVRSSSWYPLAQFGEIKIKNNLEIKWANYTSLSRPGLGACRSTNRCPAECVTGVYTDLFMLSSTDGLAVSVELIGQTQRRGPTIKLVDLHKKYEQYIITTVTQSAAYTTTTCFVFAGKPWCLSIVEMSPGTAGSMTPLSLLYPVWSSCNAVVFTMDNHETLDNQPTIFDTGIQFRLLLVIIVQL